MKLPIRKHSHPRHRRQPDQRGVTFVEILITMGLLSVLLMVLLTLFTSSIDVQTQSKGYSAVVSDSRLILTRLEYDIKRASSISTPAALGDTASSLALVIDGHTYTYSLSGGTLQLDVDGTPANLTDAEATISGLSFQKLGNAGVGSRESIRYSFTVTANAPSAHQSEIQTYTSTTERRL